ncbi:peptidoglycan DD-metalloendopeptidase family protein [Paraburkholderia ginsengiterrae]|nr:peptidoglycan DD-metalloendopeptidase family protein [Paraburkholderia ginsengiterrae]
MPLASVPAPAPAVQAGFYRVNPGDTQISVAKAFGREPPAISRWNHLSPDEGLLVGQVLRVAPPTKAGDSITSGAAANTASTPLIDADASVTNMPNASPARKSRLAWPVDGAVAAPFVPGSTKGIVLDGHAGEPVRAAATGRVVYAGNQIAAYGGLIIIKHDARLLSAYGNNGALLVKEGAVVKQGDAIAEMGTDDSGRASLRFEVRADGKPVDPLQYLPAHR